MRSKMKTVGLIFLATLQVADCMWSFRPTEYNSEVTSEKLSSSQDLLLLSPSQLLESSRPQPHYYTAAMMEIKRLEEKPICHRMAAQLLVKNCQGMKDLDVLEYQTTAERMQRHHVESFAASLAMCDMERARFEIPISCQAFRSNALEDAMRGNGKLEVTQGDVSSCLHALGKDHSHWSTWLSYRDTSLLLCRGANVDTGKDQAMKFHKQFVQMMEDFTAGLYDDMHNLRRNMAAQSQASQDHFAEAKRQAEQWKTRVQDGFEAVTENFKIASMSVNSIKSGAKDADRLVRLLVSTMVQSNAEMAAEQERAISVAAGHLKSNLERVDNLVRDNSLGLANMQDVIGKLVTAVNVLAERQDSMEQVSKNTLIALISATELVQSHEETLSHASEQVSQISQNLGKIAPVANMLAKFPNTWPWLLALVVSGVVFTMRASNFMLNFMLAGGLRLFTIVTLLGAFLLVLQTGDIECFMLVDWLCGLWAAPKASATIIKTYAKVLSHFTAAVPPLSPATAVQAALQNGTI